MWSEFIDPIITPSTFVKSCFVKTISFHNAILMFSHFVATLSARPGRFFASQFRLHRDDVKCSEWLCRRRAERLVYFAIWGRATAVFCPLMFCHSISTPLTCCAMWLVAAYYDWVGPDRLFASQFRLHRNDSKCRAWLRWRRQDTLQVEVAKSISDFVSKA